MRIVQRSPTTDNIPLLREGAVLTERYKHALAAQGIDAVWVQDELSMGIEPAELLPEPVRAETVGDLY